MMIRGLRSRLAEVRTRSEEPRDAPRVRTQSGTRYLVLAGLIMSGLLTLAITILAVVDRPLGRSTVIAALSALAGTVGWLAFIAVGDLVAWRRPSNPIGWLLLGDGLVWLTGLAIEGYVDADGRRAGAPTMGALLEGGGCVGDSDSGHDLDSVRRRVRCHRLVEVQIRGVKGLRGLTAGVAAVP